MGRLTDALMRILMAWVRGAVARICRAANGEGGGSMSAFSALWLPLLVIILITGVVVDALLWLLHYKPYVLFAARMRRRFGGEKPAEEDKMGEWLPLEPPIPENRPSEPEMDTVRDQEILREAAAVPDAELGNYPGRLYRPEEDEAESTRRFPSPGSTLESPEAPETPETPEMPRDEADYAAQLAEYERQKAQYERDLLRYEREMEAWRRAQSFPGEAEGERPRRRRGAP